MDPDQHPPRRVPAPRDGGRELRGDGGEAWYPVVPRPRVAPDLERLTVATPVARPEPAPRCTAALVVRDAGVPGVLRAWGRAVARAVHAAVDGVRTLLGALVPTPAAR